MLITIISLFSLSALLFVISLFYKGRDVNKVEKEIEQLSLDYIQEMYQIKKRLRVLEEEIMHEDTLTESSFLSTSLPIHEVIQNQVVHLSKQGLSIDQIAKQSALPINEVIQILENRGGNFH